MPKEELKEIRKKKFDEMERKLLEMKKPEDRMFYHHPSEDHIVLSHALAWVMTASVKGRLAKEKSLLLLRQYEEEMLTAYLTEDVLPLWTWIGITFVIAYVVAWVYSWFLKMTKIF